MEKSKLDALVKDTISKYLYKVSSVFDKDSPHTENLVQSYQYKRMRGQFNNCGYPTDLDDIPSFWQYKIDDSFPSSPPDTLVNSLFSSLFTKEDVIDVDVTDIDRNLFEAEEKLIKFFSQLEFIRKVLCEGDYPKASKYFQNLVDERKKEVLFSDFSKTFINAGEKGKLPRSQSYKGVPWNKKNLADNERFVAVLNCYFQDVFVGDVKSSDLDSLLVEVVSNLPKGNVSPYNKMSIEERVKLTQGGDIDEVDIVSPKFVNEFSKKLYTYFNFYCREYDGDMSVIKKMNFEKLDVNERGRFSDIQFSNILSYVDNLGLGKKWPVNIMAYTGMRNSEVMQLRKCDVIKDDTGIWFFRITKEAGKVKTANSNRIVPVHKVLIDKGFIDFVKDCSEEYLFHRYSKSEKFLTRIYTNYIRPNCQIPLKAFDGKLLTLYSFRHFVITRLMEKDVPQPYIEVMVGHSITSEKSITKNYTHPDNIKLMKEYIDRISTDFA